MAGHILLAPLLSGLGLVARGPVLLLAIAAGWVGGIHPRLHHLLHDLQLLLGTHPEALGEPKRPFEAMTSSIMAEVFLLLPQLPGFLSKHSLASNFLLVLNTVALDTPMISDMAIWAWSKSATRCLLASIFVTG